MVGSHLLLDLVRSGENVRALYRKHSKIEAVKRVFLYEVSENEAAHLLEKIEWVQADITNVPALEKAFSGIRKVYHCAALVSFNSPEYKTMRKTNIEGTANVVNLCIQNKIEKLCFTSSIATLDQNVGETFISETSSWNNEKDHSMYAITKYGAEIEVWRAGQEGVPVVIVNPGVIVGSGFWHSGSGLLFKKVQRGLTYSSSKVTGFVGVYDVVNAMRLLMENPVKNEQYVLVSENLSFQKVLEKISSAIGKPAPARELKPWMIQVGWITQKLTGFLIKTNFHLTRQSHKTLFEKYFYSSQKITDKFKFNFQPMEEVINKTGASFKKDV